MVNAYATIGIFETIAAYFAFFWVFKDFGFSLQQVVGTGVDFEKPYDELSDKMKNTFEVLCQNNDVFTGDCGDEFTHYRGMVLRKA